jgi:hypothetical protein
MSAPTVAPRAYVIYCDESRHDAHHANPFMGIGGLWVPRDARDALKFELDRVAVAHGLRGELKWSKVSARSLAGYKAFVDVFVRHTAACFRIILVEREQLDLRTFHQGDGELGFYKFYYLMLVKWLEPASEYVILLDHRFNSAEGRLPKLQEVLDSSVSFSTRIHHLGVVDSKDSRLSQLADLLTGATTAAACASPANASPKRELQQYLARAVGRSQLALASSGPAKSKFNVFRIRLQPKGV